MTTRSLSPVLTISINPDAFMKAAGITQEDARKLVSPYSDHSQDHIPPEERQSSHSVKSASRSPGGDPSVLPGNEAQEGAVRALTQKPDMAFVPQVLSSTQHKLAAAQRRFWSFVLPDGEFLEPRLREILVKQAFAATAAPVAPQGSQAASLQDAQAAMQSFLPQKPLMAGQGPMQTGLDGPSDTRAAAMPGTPGHAATNVIDQQGGLDPRGMTVDGNNAAGVPKGFKMGEARESSHSSDSLMKEALDHFALSELSQRLGGGQPPAATRQSSQSSHSPTTTGGGSESSHSSQSVHLPTPGTAGGSAAAHGQSMGPNADQSTVAPPGGNPGLPISGTGI